MHALLLALTLTSTTPTPTPSPVASVDLVTRHTQTTAITVDVARAMQRLRTPSTRSLGVFDIHRDAFQAGRVRFTLPDRSVVTLERTFFSERDARNFEWGAAGADDASLSATVVSVDGQLAGSLTSSSKGLYRLHSLPDGTIAVENVDTKRMPMEEPADFIERVRVGVLPRHSAEPLPTHDATGGITRVDVMVGYTPAAKANVPNIKATIALAVAEANQSYANSGVNIELALVDQFELSGYSEAGKTFDSILADFAAGSITAAHRVSSHADLAALIVEKRDYCGLADAILADASHAFAIVNDDCATGYYSFAHELGHLMGARHNAESDANLTPFAYGHGMRHDDAPSWRTIMAYDCPTGCTRIQHWATPTRKYNGFTLGTATLNDDARVLNETARRVAAFRP